MSSTNTTIAYTLDGTQRGYSARDLEGNLWTFGTAKPKR